MNNRSKVIESFYLSRKLDDKTSNSDRVSIRRPLLLSRSRYIFQSLLWMQCNLCARTWNVYMTKDFVLLFRLFFLWHYLSKQYLVIPFELTVLKRIVCESNVSGLTPPIFSHVTAEQQSVGINGKWTVDNRGRACWNKYRILYLIEIYLIVQLSSPVLAKNQENTIPRKRRAIVVMFVARLPLASRVQTILELRYCVPRIFANVASTCTRRSTVGIACVIDRKR